MTINLITDKESILINPNINLQYCLENMISNTCIIEHPILNILTCYNNSYIIGDLVLNLIDDNFGNRPCVDKDIIKNNINKIQEIIKIIDNEKQY